MNICASRGHVESRARRTASNSSATKETKPLGFLDPGAEYMSKFERGKAKNEKAVAGSQLPVARKTLGSSGISLRTENWQLATAYDVGTGGQSGGHLGGSAGGNDDVVIVTRAETTEHRRCLLWLA
jgi:hypothetical protein